MKGELANLAVDRSHHEPKGNIMIRIQHIRRFTAVLAGLASALLASAAVAAPSFASVPHPGIRGMFARRDSTLAECAPLYTHRSHLGCWQPVLSVISTPTRQSC